MSIAKVAWGDVLLYCQYLSTSGAIDRSTRVLCAARGTTGGKRCPCVYHRCPLSCCLTICTASGRYPKAMQTMHCAGTKRRVSEQVRHLITTDLTSSRRKRRELGLWQRRFWEHQIRDNLDFAKHVDYVHWNPVKHGYVIRVADWPYSSFHRYVTRGLYPLNWASHAKDDAGRMGEALQSCA